MSNKYLLTNKKVHSIKQIAYGVYILSFLRDFEFIAGQVIAIDLVPDDKPRLYSIASGENDKYIEILFDEKNGGKLTPFLSKLKTGDEFYASAPFGTFRSSKKSAFFIAAGTGIAPFSSMIQSGNHQNKTIVHGGKTDQNFYYSEKLETLIPGRYVRCNSQEVETKYYKGRLTEWLIKQENLPKEIEYYLCGSPEMVVQVRDILIKKEIPFNNIVSETYF